MGEEKADDKIDEIGNEDIKDKPEKALNHQLNLSDFRPGVKPNPRGNFWSPLDS
jgi:hypothetical protein